MLRKVVEDHCPQIHWFCQENPPPPPPPSPPHHCPPPERRSKWSASLNFVSGVLLVRHNGRPVPVVPVHRHQICTTNPPTLLIQVLRGSKKHPKCGRFFHNGFLGHFSAVNKGVFGRQEDLQFWCRGVFVPRLRARLEFSGK